MGLLDPIPERYTPPNSPHRKFKPPTLEENLSALNNEDRKKRTEDFEDSPFADRV